MPNSSPLIVALAGQKGGPGKSTIAACLASEWHRQGRRTLLVDADPQGTSLTWAEVASEFGVSCPTVVAMGDNLRQQLPKLAMGFDMVVIDCPGRISVRQLGALMLADVVLLPSGPSTPDIWALNKSVELIGEVKALKPDLIAVVVLNRLSVTTTESRQARDVVAEAGLPVMAATLSQRVAYSEAMAAGQGVTTHVPSSIAASEIRVLAEELESFLQPSLPTETHIHA